MKIQDIIEKLIDASVVEEESGKISITPSFKSATHDETANGNIPDLLDTVIEPGGNSTTDDSIDYPSLSHNFSALNEFLPNLSQDIKAKSALIIEVIQYEPESEEGVPEGFLPIPCDIINVITLLNERSMLYIWRDDCRPCEVMCNNLSNISNREVEDVGKYSVYGPECPVYLEAEYNVVTGPTTLFLLNGEIKSRLVGAYNVTSINSEMKRALEI